MNSKYHPSATFTPTGRDEGGEIPDALGEMLKPGLSLLWRSYEYTKDQATGCWEFAVERYELFQAGFSEVDLRWLLARGYVWCETPSADHLRKRPEKQQYTFSGQSDRLLLTDAGALFASTILAAATSISPRNASYFAAVGPGRSVQKPVWDPDRKELRCGQIVIKQFRWAAVNQETILMAFEEEGWPARIDDPLPQKPDQDPKCRLHDTIKCLNRHHKRRLMQFRGDGTGEGVLWRLLADSDF